MAADPAMSPVDHPPPDWSSISEEILCPMCEYNLRTLTAPMCPECGYRFDWSDLLDPQRRRHLFLFEHHPDRRLWAFARTLFAGLTPESFWTNLRASQPSHPQRLALYALLVFLPLLVALALGLIADLISPSIRAQLLSPAGLLQTLEDPYTVLGALWQPASYLLLWPVATVGALLIFQISMRRARVRNIHALRCAVYSFDVLFWAGLALFVWAAGMFVAVLGGARGRLDRTPGCIQALIPLVILILMSLVTLRLITAYRHYLQFDRPALTVAASQIIVGLTLLLLAVTRLSVGRNVLIASPP